MFPELCTVLQLKQKHVPFRMPTENVELVHECCAQHLRMGSVNS